MNLVGDLQRFLVGKTARHTFWTMTGNAVNVLSVLLFTVVATRLLSPTDYGVLTVALALFVIGFDIFDFGLSATLVRFVAGVARNQEWTKISNFFASATLLRFIASLALLLLATLASIPLAHLFLHDKSQASLIFLAVIGAISLLWFNHFSATLQGLQQFEKSSLLNICLGLSRMLLVFLIGLGPSLAFLIAAFVFSPIPAAMLGSLLIPRRVWFGVVTKDTTKQLVRFSGWLALFGILSTLQSRLDVLMLSSLQSPHQAGIYGAAFRLVSIFVLATASFGTVLVPKFSQIHHNELPLLIKKTLVGISLLLLAMAAAFLLADTLVPLLATYQESVPLFRLLVIAHIPFVLSLPAMAALYTLNKPQVFAIIAFLQLVMTVGANWLLIPLWGAVGAAITVGLAYLLGLVIVWIYVLAMVRKSNV